jgi:hypothetical protein
LIVALLIIKKLSLLTIPIFINIDIIASAIFSLLCESLTLRILIKRLRFFKFLLRKYATTVISPRELGELYRSKLI